MGFQEKKESSTIGRKIVMLKRPEAQRGDAPTSVLTVRHDSRDQWEEEMAEHPGSCSRRYSKALTGQDGRGRHEAMDENSDQRCRLCPCVQRKRPERTQGYGLQGWSCLGVEVGRRLELPHTVLKGRISLDLKIVYLYTCVTSPNSTQNKSWWMEHAA